VTIKFLKNPKSDIYYQFKNLVQSSSVPWYYTEKTLISQNNKKDFPFYSHAILNRPLEINKSVTKIDSSLFDDAYMVLKEILKKNNLDFSVFLRINLNSTFDWHEDTNTYHTDFKFPHKNLLIYLSPFTKGQTIINEKTLEVKEDDILFFDGLLKHKNKTPNKHERRIVMVVCYI
jgi:hypothetical protein